MFTRVFARGNRIQGKGFKIYILKDSNLNRLVTDNQKQNGKIFKLGISINRRFGNAPERNREKRRIRAIFRELIDDLKDNYYMIIRPASHLKNISYEETQKNIVELLKGYGAI